MDNAIRLPLPSAPVNCNADPAREERSAKIRALEVAIEAKRIARLSRPLYPASVVRGEEQAVEVVS